uniref:Uncharacterized protein n=1 Tax=Nelumbo nucifera TaxID=4432 RepID=A0A822XQD5_NELNU|nr:TPA_asm: hypothetical protein HUJ06_024010 [Nelumbo nucifera]
MLKTLRLRNGSRLKCRCLASGLRILIHCACAWRNLGVGLMVGTRRKVSGLDPCGRFELVLMGDCRF